MAKLRIQPAVTVQSLLRKRRQKITYKIQNHTLAIYDIPRQNNIHVKT